MTGVQPAIESPAKAVNRDTGVVDGDNPWPGLASFRESDRAFFHGRDAAIQALTELVGRARASVLYGASGLGKTSLIQAGLFPRARANDLFPVRIRLRIASVDDDPAEQIRGALEREAAENRIETPSRRPGDTLWEFFYRKDSLWWNDRHRIVIPLLVFDQFEEIFTVACRNTVTAGVARQFLVDLRGIILGFPPDIVKARCDADPDEALQYSLSRSPVRVLFSFREDYLAEFLELRDLFPAVADNDYRLLRMTVDDALRVVLKAGGHLVEEPVARRIVEIIAAARKSKAMSGGVLSVDPALLSVFCRELNNERRSLHLPQITEELLKDKQATILENFYIRSLDGLDPRIRVFIENELLLPDSAERNSVAEQVALRRPGVTADALESLIDRRLLRRDERDGPARIELTHDVLIDPVRRSRDARLVREQEEQRVAAERDAEEKNRQAASRERLKRFSAIVVVIALIAAGGWSVAWVKGQATSRALATASLVQASAQYGTQGRSDIALAYLAYAVNTDTSNVYARGKLVDNLLRRTWPMPEAVLRHEGPVWWAQFHPDGTRILTVDNTGVRLWPWSPQREERAPQPLGGQVQSARFTPDGTYVLTIRPAGGVEVWDSQQRRSVRRIVPEAGDPITAAAMDRASSRLATGTRSGTLRLWDVGTADKKEIWKVVKDGVEEISSIQFAADGSRLVTVSQDGTVRLWSSRAGEQLASFYETGTVAAQFSPNGSDLVTTSLQGHATLWRTSAVPATRGPARRSAAFQQVALLGHTAAVRSVQFSGDGRRILTASDDGTARVWDAASGGTVGLPLQHRAAVVSAFFDTDGARVVTASTDKSARVWDAKTGAPLTEPIWHERAVASATFSPDGQRVVTASGDGTAEVWDVRPGVALPIILKTEGSVQSLQFTPDGRTVLYSASDHKASSWNTDSDRVIAHPIEGLAPARFSPDGTLFLVFKDRTASLLKTETGERIAAAMNQDDPIAYALWSNDGRRIATVGDGGTVQLWNASNGSPIGKAWVPVAGNGLMTVVLSDDARLLAASRATGTAGDDTQQAAALWDVSRASPGRIATMKASSRPLYRLEFDPSSRWLLGYTVVPITDAAFVWPVGKGAAVEAIKLPQGADILAAHFSFDGNRIVIASEDGTTKIWTNPRGARTPAELQHAAQVNEAVFSPDGLRVLTASDDGTARLWDAETGDTASLPLRHDGSVSIARFSRDGERVVTAADDGFLRVWDLHLGKPGDVKALAVLAESLSGYSVDVDRTLTRLELNDRLERQRQATGLTRGSDSLAARVVKWILEDRSKRTISPFSTKTVQAKAGGQ